MTVTMEQRIGSVRRSERSGAIFDETKVYRYYLWRPIKPGEQVVTFVLLNPSTADDQINDPTVRRCIGFARAWDYAGVQVVNLFAYRSTNPLGMLGADDPIGSENDAALVTAAHASDLVVCAWGAGGSHWGRGRTVAAMLWGEGVPLCHLGMTFTNHEPRHPLYLAGGTQPLSWRGYP